MQALSAMRKARRRKRIDEVDWLDAMYRVYVTAIVGIVVVLFISSFVGDNELTASELADFREHGPAAIGLLAALAIAGGLRSGARGGPLALEPAEVRHVLLAPVDRASALRSPVLKQLRFGIFVGAVVGRDRRAARRPPACPEPPWRGWRAGEPPARSLPHCSSRPRCARPGGSSAKRGRRSSERHSSRGRRSTSPRSCRHRQRPWAAWRLWPLRVEPDRSARGRGGGGPPGARRARHRWHLRRGGRAAHRPGRSAAFRRDRAGPSDGDRPAAPARPRPSPHAAVDPAASRGSTPAGVAPGLVGHLPLPRSAARPPGVARSCCGPLRPRRRGRARRHCSSSPHSRSSWRRSTHSSHSRSRSIKPTCLTRCRSARARCSSATCRRGSS